MFSGAHPQVHASLSPADAGASETHKRERFTAGELALDLLSMRPALEAAGLQYVDRRSPEPDKECS
jgi:hypothetical protein